MKKEFYLFLVIFLILILFLPQITLAEEIQLSDQDILKLFPATQNGLMKYWISSTSSETFNEPEKQAVIFLIRGAIQNKQLNYILDELPKEGLIKLSHLVNFLIGAPDAGAILDKIDKENLKYYINILKDWFLQNEVKIATGTLNYPFESYNHNKQNPTFYYNLVYKPRINNYTDLAIEFYSPENIEPKKASAHVMGINTWCWDFASWQNKGNKYIKPFVFKISGRILYHEQEDYYTWYQTLSSEITFPESVPELSIAEQPTFFEQLKENLIKSIVEKILPIPYELVEIIKDKIIDMLSKSQNLSLDKQTQKADITEFLESRKKQEAFIEEITTEIKESEQKETDSQENASKLEWNLDKVQEILDDISEKIDIMNQEITNLASTQTASIEDVIEKDQEKIIENEEKTEESEKEQQESSAPAAICQKTPGSFPERNKVILNEIAWMGTTSSSNDEWIELKNISNYYIDLTGWQLLDKNQNIKIIFEETGIPQTGFYLLERTDDNTLPEITADTIYNGNLNNTNESIYLFNSDCQLQDELEVFSEWPGGDNVSKRTLERKNDFLWQTSSIIGGTPKDANSNGYVAPYVGGGGGGTTTEPSKPCEKVLISEIQIEGNTDFIEFYNPLDHSVDISSYQIKKKNQVGTEYSIRLLPEETNIPPLSYLLWATSQNNYHQTVSAELYSSAYIAPNNSVVLLDRNKDIVDAVAWGQEHTNPFSEGLAFAQNPSNEQTIGRKWNSENQTYQDSDDNQQDFELQFPTPKEENQTFQDVVPPETIINDAPLSLTTETTTLFTFSSNENNSTFECKIDEGEWKNCFESIIYEYLSNGNHIFYVRATDIANNQDDSPATHSWTIDTSIDNPILSLSDLSSNSNYYTNEITIKLTIQNDQEAQGWFLSENEEDVYEEEINWQTEKPQQFVLSEQNGQKIVYLWVKDNMDNTSSATSATINLDNQVPIVNFVDLQPKYHSTTFTINWTGEDLISGINEYHLNFREESEEYSDEWQILSEDNYQFSGEESHIYHFKIRAKDNAENVSEWSKEISTTIELPYSQLAVVINEIAWMGTKANGTDEWIELHNNTEEDIDLTNWKLKSSDADGPELILTNSILAKSFYLIERTDDNSTSEPADLVSPFGNGLGNNPNCEVLFLYDPYDNAIDQTICVENGNWPKGEASPNYISMERIKSTLNGYDPLNWANNNLITRNGLSAEKEEIKYPINGTPRNKNSVSKSSTEIINNLPFDEFDQITLTLLGSPYEIKGPVSVPENKTLIIEPGGTLKFSSNDYGLDVAGTLKAIGTEDNQIIFSGMTVGGYWKGFYFTETSINSELSWVKISYAMGSAWKSNPAILVENSSIDLKNSILENYYNQGIRLTNSMSLIENTDFLGPGQDGQTMGINIEQGSPTIQNCSLIKDNYYGIHVQSESRPFIKNNNLEDNYWPIYVANSAQFLPVFGNNQGKNNSWDAISLTGTIIEDAVLEKNTLPYLISAFLNIAEDITLEIKHGVTITLKDESSLNIYGTLLAQGISDDKIIFGAYPGQSFWDKIYFSPQSSNSILENIEINGGGYNNWHDNKGEVIVDETTVNFNNVTFNYSYWVGIYFNNSNSIVENCSFGNNQIGLKIEGADNSPQISNYYFENNEKTDIYWPGGGEGCESFKSSETIKVECGCCPY